MHPYDPPTAGNSLTRHLDRPRELVSLCIMLVKSEGLGLSALQLPAQWEDYCDQLIHSCDDR
jgi:hypothetical protein